MSQRQRRFAEDEEYRDGWFGDPRVPSHDYDDGFTAGTRSAWHRFDRLFAVYLVAFVAMAITAFVIAWSMHP